MGEIITRPANSSDAHAVTRLLIERKYDAVPYQDTHNAKRLAWWTEHGEAHNFQEIQLYRSDPTNHFFNVASIGGSVVGYLMATSYLDPAPIEGGPFINAQGLMVAKEHESQGVARRLTRDFCEWALPIGRAVCLQVAVGNEHARNLYESHGCEYVKSVPATPDAPPLDILLLPYERLVELA